MPHSTQLDNERIATLTPENQPGVRVVHRHHLLGCSHWLNVPILLGLILSGVSVYWASPVYQHKRHPQTGSFDPLTNIRIWICVHVPGSHHSFPMHEQITLLVCVEGWSAIACGPD